MRLRTLILFAPVLFLATFANSASAQTLFVEGTVFASIERRSSTQSNTGDVDTPNLNGVVAGGGFAVGTFLTPSVSVRAQVALPARLEDAGESVRTPFVDEPVPPGVVLPTIRQQFEASEKTSTFSVLVGYHTARRHNVQLAYLGGAAFLVGERRSRYTLSYELPPEVLAYSLVPAETVTEFSSTGYTVTAEVGIDADVAVSARWSLVPQARLMGYGGGLTFRSGVALRGRW
jgi:hypothetical protein